ncbi:MAG TPA: DUF4351 domain-containing protein [Thermoanaerobacterales bacterium]|nr:DUF4351 domain-containing protein [Thermoanaerobacterales bacterium]
MTEIKYLFLYFLRQKLYIMLPLRIINLSEQLENLKKRKLQDEEKTKLQNEYRRKITEVIESIIKELKDALITNELIIEECNKILLELSTLAGELFSEEVKDIVQEVNEMAKMIIDPEIYRRGFEEGIEKGKTIINQELYQKGLEKGLEKGIAETVVRLLCKRLGELPIEYKERIQGQDRPTLELIADHIFDIKSLSDLDRFLKQ